MADDLNSREHLVKKLELAKARFLNDEISADEYAKLREDIKLKLKALDEKGVKDGKTDKPKADNIVRKRFSVKGMTCHNCEKIIKKRAMSVDGVKDVFVDYSSGEAQVKFDSSKTSLGEIFGKIEEEGYSCSGGEKPQQDSGRDWTDYAVAVVGIIVLGYFLLHFVDSIQLPQLSPAMGYGLLFVVGLLTGFHCVAMCGGFVVSYTAKNAQEGRSSKTSHVAYGAGKLMSYTVIGAAFGLVGSVVAFTPLMRGVAGVLSGLFLVVFGLSMLDVHPVFRRFRFSTPGFLAKFVGKKNKDSGPFMVGLLNGLMIACGPLQAIYIMAAGTGSLVEGAKLLFVFGLGTLPVMLGFGYLTSFISSKMANKILRASGAVVIILGLIMINRGLALTGTGYDFSSVLASSGSAGQDPGSGSSAVISGGYQEIKMDVLVSGWSPNSFVLKKGMPVKWIINAKELTGCNNAIQVPKLGLSFKLKPGLQTIEFTPNEAGVVPFSCWMGMIRGQFIVKDNINLADTAAVQKELAAAPAPKRGSCGGSGGGCGCGG